MNKTEIQSSNRVPSSLAQVGTIMKYTFLDYLRSRRFFILLTLNFIISALITVLVGYYRPQSFLLNSLSFYSSWWGNGATFVTILGGIFFGGDAISGEFQNRTGYFGVPNPIRRSSIYIGKWLAAFIAATVIFLIYAAITVGNGIYYFGLNIPIEFGESLLFAWFYLATVMGFTFFFSSMFKNSSISILITAILFLFVFSLIETLVSILVKIEPWFILTYGAGIISSVLTVPYPEHVHTQTFGQQITLTTYTAFISEGLAIMAVYFIVTAALGLLLFERKEFT
ncbi:MAG TPA: ABC transporter permease [Candidatus Bathyarchaeia archaeon]|jgi:ABC-2 type transport system permease protein|nr:ABC transporter permease [Candidatus Bathyarchaeia archaeon]